MRIYLTCAVALLLLSGCALFQNPDGSLNREAAGEAVSTGGELAREGLALAATDDPDWFSFGEKIIMSVLGLGVAGAGAVKLKKMKP